MTAARFDIEVDHGTTLSRKFHVLVTDVDMQGFTALAQVRKTEDSTSTIIDFATVANPIEVVANGTDNYIWLRLSAEECAALTPGNYVWDMKVVNGAEVQRWVKGIFTIGKVVTR